MHIHNSASCAPHADMSRLICAPRTKNIRYFITMDSQNHTLRRARAARLKLAREFRLGAHTTATEGASFVDVKKDAYLQHENGNRLITDKRAQLYGEKLGVPGEWLLWGNNPPDFIFDTLAQKSDPDTERLPDNGNRFQPVNRSIKSSHTAQKAPTVPVVGVLEFGAWRKMRKSDEPLGEIFFQDNKYDNSDLFGFVINGVSDFFPHGSTLICTDVRKKSPRVNGYVVLRTVRGELAETTLKRVAKSPSGAIILNSANPGREGGASVLLSDLIRGSVDGMEMVATVVVKYEDVEGDGEFVDIRAPHDVSA